MKIGVAISVYNKVEEVATNVEIIRNHWLLGKDVFISVCCNDPTSIDRIKRLAVDSVALGDPIPSTPKPNLRRRQFDCIKKSTAACQADYVVHWHADAFAIAYQPIHEIMTIMEENDFVAAFRGRGLDYRNPKTVYGDCDDHFLFLSRTALDDGLLDVDPEQYVQQCNVESFLSLRLTEHRERVWHYSTMSQNLVGTTLDDNFYPDRIQHRAMNPWNIDHERGFIHAQTRDLIREKLLGYGVPQELIKL